MTEEKSNTAWAGKQGLVDVAGIGLITYGVTLLESGDILGGAVAIGSGLTLSIARHLL